VSSECCTSLLYICSGPRDLAVMQHPDLLFCRRRPSSPPPAAPPPAPASTPAWTIAAQHRARLVLTLASHAPNSDRRGGPHHGERNR
jgi:hypothetical protein